MVPIVTPPILFDKALLRDHARRAARQGPATFLFDRAVDELSERLCAVNRSFRSLLDLGSPGAGAAAALAARYGPDLLVRTASVSEFLAPGPYLSVLADEEQIPFGADRFDLIVSLLALQHANDLPGALAQIRRALKPDGLFLACLVGGESLRELRLALAQAESELYGGASPRVAPFADLRDLGGLLQRAGFALPVTDVDALTVRYDSLFGLLRDLRAMGASSALKERARRPVSRRFWMRAAAIYAERFSDPDGRVRARFDLVWLSGWAPHESQAKPLQPGSARMRLADALGVKETKLGS
jgi:SAM-dependent methyltransferase